MPPRALPGSHALDKPENRPLLPLMPQPGLKPPLSTDGRARAGAITSPLIPPVSRATFPDCSMSCGLGAGSPLSPY